MEMMLDSFHEMYEVEKIINCKTFRNKKYYLIKWLCYPISQSTWEPKSNLKHLNYLIEEFEAGYPFSVDQGMYNIFREEVKKQKSIKRRNKIIKNSTNDKKFLSKKKKIEGFSDTDLIDEYYDKLKTHLYINTYKKQNSELNSLNESLIIDLSSTNTPSEENVCNNSSQKQDIVKIQDENDKIDDKLKLVMPKLA